MKKKMFSLLVIAAMMLAMLAGCGSSSAASAAVSASASAEASEVSAASAEAAEAEPAVVEAEEEEESEAAPAEEASTEEAASAAEEEAPAEIEHLIDFPLEDGLEISISMSTTPSLTGSSLVSTDGSELGWATWLEERTGANIEVDLYSFLDSADKQNLMIASGDYTDIIVGSLSYSGGVDGAVEDGILTNLWDYVDYMPDYINTLFGSDIDTVAQAFSTDFNLTAFYGIRDSEALAEYGPAIRQDWLDELGLDTPVTYDDWHDVLTAFKENYNATLWITSYGDVPGDLGGGYGSMGYAGGTGFPTWTDPETGEFKFAVYEEGYKEYLRTMHQWYEEGLIYPDFISLGGSDYPDTTLIDNGNIGVWFTYVSYLAAEQELLTEADSNGVIAGIAYPLESADQEINEATYSKAASAGGVDGMGGFSVTTASDNIEELCAVINEFFTPDGYDFCNWGTEGETYVVNDDGSRSFTDLITDDEYGLGANIMMTYYFFKDGPFHYDNDRYLASYNDMQLAAANTWTGSRVSSETSTLDTDQTTQYNNIKSDVSTFYQEYTVKFITGDKDIDADWDEYIEALEGCGVEDMMELGQTGIDQYNDRISEIETQFADYLK